MKEEYIPKIGFKNHEVHHEFMVIPFGLTNAKRKSIMKLVFFDDILIYRKYWEEHVQHVERLLHVLNEQQPYGKPSKCFFRVREVEYLGHNLSHEGV